MYGFQGRIYRVGLTRVISADFFCFVLLFAHKLCIRRNFSPWAACKFLSTPQIFRIWCLRCAVGCLNCFFGGPLLLLMYTSASFQTMVGVLGGGGFLCLVFFLIILFFSNWAALGSCCRARTAPQSHPSCMLHGKGVEKASSKEVPFRNAFCVCKTVFSSARRY